MDVNYQIYKPLYSQSQYQRYISRQRQSQITSKKKLFYDQLLKNPHPRYQRQFLLQLQTQISPFQDSIDTFRQNLQKKYPDIPQNILNQCLQYIFHKKIRDAKFSKENYNLDDYSRNRLKKEDFTYSFDKSKDLSDSLTPIDTSRNDAKDDNILNKSQRESNPKRSGKSKDDNPSTFSPLKPRRKVASITKNRVIRKVIKQQPIQQQNYDTPKNFNTRMQQQKKILKTDHSIKSTTFNNNQSFSNFKNQDIMVSIDGKGETQRTDLQQLLRILSQGNIKYQNIQQINSLSDRGIKIIQNCKKNIQNLRPSSRKRKVGGIKKCANRIKTQHE